MAGGSTRARTLALTVACAGYLGLSFVTFDQIEEDAFIYFRLAQNIADGHGYVFNHGGPPVEAASSPLWLALLVLAAWCGLELVLAAKWMGLACGVASLVLADRLAGTCVARPWLRAAAPIATALSVPFLMWQQRGLETPLYALVVLGLAYCASDARRARWLAVPAAAMVLARPEGPVMLVALAPVLWLHRRDRRVLLPTVVVPAATLLALLAWRFALFHDLAPTPFYVKFPGGSEWSRVHLFLHDNVLYPFVAVLALAAWRRAFWSRPRVVLVSLMAVFMLWSARARDYMPYYRHLVPIVPLVYVLLLSAADFLLDRVRSSWRPLAFVYAAALVVSTAALSTHRRYFGREGEHPVGAKLQQLIRDPATLLGEVSRKIANPHPMPEPEKRTLQPGLGCNGQALIGEFIRRNYRSGAVVVYDQMGQTPYYAGFDKRFIDVEGLASPSIARHRMHARAESPLLQSYMHLVDWMRRTVFDEYARFGSDEEIITYALDAEPDVVLVSEFAAGAPATLVPQLKDHPAFEHRFEKRAVVANWVTLYEPRQRPRRGYDVPLGLQVEVVEPAKEEVPMLAGLPRPQAGRWQKFRTHRFDENLAQVQRDTIARLEALGYADGVTEAPAQQGVVRHDPERAQQGLNFFTSGHRPEAQLMTMKGDVVHSWHYPFEKVWPDYPGWKDAMGRQFWRRAYLFENGDVLAIYEGLGIIKLDKHSNLLWANPNRAHHDLWVGPDGMIFVLTREAHIVPRINEREPILEDFVSVLDPYGRELSRFSVLEALERSRFGDLVEQSPKQGDIFHTNSLERIEVDATSVHPAFQRGNFLTSVFWLDRIGVLDPRREVFVWVHHGDYAKQHDPTLVDGSRILLFDNRDRPDGSEVLEIDPRTGKKTWSYTGSAEDPFFSGTCGTAQRLANGNTLITESDNGRAFEIDREKRIVWEFYNPHRAGDDDEYIAVLLEVRRLPADFPTDWMDEAEDGQREAQAPALRSGASRAAR